MKEDLLEVTIRVKLNEEFASKEELEKLTDTQVADVVGEFFCDSPLLFVQGSHWELKRLYKEVRKPN